MRRMVEMFLNRPNRLGKMANVYASLNVGLKRICTC